MKPTHRCTISRRYKHSNMLEFFSAFDNICIDVGYEYIYRSVESYAAKYGLPRTGFNSWSNDSMEVVIERLPIEECYQKQRSCNSWLHEVMPDLLTPYGW